MKKFFSLITFMVLVFFGTIYSQGWTNLGNFPDSLLKGNSAGHGVAVDPDGKVWFGFYGAVDSAFDASQNKYVLWRLIYIFNADGTPASFSPMKSITVGGVTDTLFNSFRGMKTDNDGNILYSSFDALYRIDYKTGEGMAKVIPQAGMTLTAPAVCPTNGNVFIGPVSPGFPIKEYTSDFTFVGDVVGSSTGFSRTLEVSADGNTVYWTAFTNFQVLIYSRATEFDPFTLQDSTLQGFAVESATWSRDGKLLWLSAGNLLAGNNPNSYPGVTTYYSLTTWYAYDPATKTLVDSIKWEFHPGTAIADQRPRGLAFSNDGEFAYATCFGGSTLPAIQKFQKPVSVPVDITFEVDMGVQAYKGKFNPAADAVKIAGNFNGWNNGADVMTDLDGDTVYTITKTFTSGENLEFKFIKGADGWEGVDNRKYTVPATNSVFSAFFDNDNSYQILTPVNVTFACNMELENVSGRFNPATDTVGAAGSFNGWSTSTWPMAPSIGDPNIYEITKSVNTFAGETFNYKFIYKTGLGTSWEGDPNKTYTVTSDDITNGFTPIILRGFNNLTLDNVTNFDCTIKFTVNMAGAISAKNNLPISPVTNVKLCGAVVPLRWPAGGWPDPDVNLTIDLYDDGTNGDLTAGDNVWSKNVVFSQYSPLRIQYKYGANWGASISTGGNDNENGVAQDHFIDLTPTMLSATVENVFGAMGDHPLVNIVLDVVSELPGTPESYNLAQNFPNPFNPSTSIRFSIPEAGLVTVRVFNLLGEDVATLVNDYKNAGNYDVQFDASRLTTGVYFYSISVNNFASTKKMVLTK